MAPRHPRRIPFVLRTMRLALSASLLALLLLSACVKASSLPGDFQSFRGALTPRGSSESVSRAGPVGFLVDFSLFSNLERRTGALFVPSPFATLFADIYVDRHVAVRPAVARACPRSRIKALDPELPVVNTCIASSQLGRGLASGFLRNVGSPPGEYLRALDLQVRAFRGSANDEFVFYLYSELSKERLVPAKVWRLGNRGRFGSRIRFTIPRALIAPSSSLISQLAGFNIKIPASAAGGKGLFRLKRCPPDGKLRLGFRAFYNENLATKGGPLNPDGFAVNSESPLLTATSGCR